MDSITNSLEKFWSTGKWSLADSQPIELGDAKSLIDDIALPFLSTPEQWDNYNDEIIYQADKLTREFIEKMKDTDEWRCNKSSARRNPEKAFTFAQLVQTLYGQDYQTLGFSSMTNKIAKVFAYYSSAITKTKKKANGKWSQKSCYHLSVTRLKQPPYSLKLRLEELTKDGSIPDPKQFKLPTDDLKPGHARNKRTEENMQKRSEEARRRYNERYNRSDSERSKREAE